MWARAWWALAGTPVTAVRKRSPVGEVRDVTAVLVAATLASAWSAALMLPVRTSSVAAHHRRVRPLTDVVEGLAAVRGNRDLPSRWPGLPTPRDEDRSRRHRSAYGERTGASSAEGSIRSTETSPTAAAPR